MHSYTTFHTYKDVLNLINNIIVEVIFGLTDIE